MVTDRSGGGHGFVVVVGHDGQPALIEGKLLDPRRVRRGGSRCGHGFLVLERSVGGGPADAKRLHEGRDGLAGIVEGTELAGLVRGEGGWATDMLPSVPGGLASDRRAFVDQLSLVLSEGGEEADHEASGGGGAVGPVGDRPDVNASGSEVCHGLHDVAQAAAETIETPHDDDVSLAGVGE